MFDIGWSELLVIGIVALIVVGPKDLPQMFRALGKFTGKARKLARDFQRAMDDAANETGFKDTAKDLKSMTSSKNLGLDRLNEAAEKFDKWDPTKKTGGKSTGTNTAQLSKERAEAARKISEAAARRAEERKAAEAAEAAARETPKADTDGDKA